MSEIDDITKARHHALGRDCGFPCDACGASAKAWVEREAAKVSPEARRMAESLLGHVAASQDKGAGTCLRTSGCMMPAGHWTCCVVP